MPKKIDKDHARFRNIIRGKIRKDLKNHIANDEMIGKKGNDIVSIPIPRIKIPTFRHGNNGEGVGQGKGDNGQPINGKAGNKPGKHMLEAEVTLEELAQMMSEELQLPRIKPKDKDVIQSDAWQYTSIAKVGPESLRNFKRTYKEALKRQVASGTYDPKNPTIIPYKEDKRYRSRKPKPKQNSNAVVFFMMDVSASMGQTQKDIIRTETFWIDTWLRAHYKKIVIVYIVHDTDAKEVDRETFFHIKEAGGTKISSAYKLCVQLINTTYSPNDWNLYAFHFSDGDNFSDDNQICVDVLRDTLLPALNLFCYGQVSITDTFSEFKTVIDNLFKGNEKVITNGIYNRDGIYPSIKAFLGTGK